MMDKLKEIRNELLKLHKTLMDIEKGNYEVENGKVTPTQLLQLLFDDERFAWLRTISILVTEIDELFADKKGLNIELAQALWQKTNSLFDDGEEFKDFKKRYQANLDVERAVSIQHSNIMNLLNNKKA